MLLHTSFAIKRFFIYNWANQADFNVTFSEIFYDFFDDFVGLTKLIQGIYSNLKLY